MKLSALFKRFLRKECHHCFAYYASRGIKQCIDCGATYPITNVVKHQR